VTSLVQTIRPLLFAPVGAIGIFTLVTLPQALDLADLRPLLCQCSS
jgi:hypothetical protein